MRNAVEDINHILSIQNANKASMLAHYYQTLSIEKVKEFANSLMKATQVVDQIGINATSTLVESNNSNLNKILNDSTKIKQNSNLKDFEILNCVANFVNPYTGEVITGIDELLKLKLEEISYSLKLIDSENSYIHLKKLNRTKQQCDEDFPMAWEKWTEQEDLMLIEEFKQGLSIAEIAEKHNRKKGGIMARLKKHKLID